MNWQIYFDLTQAVIIISETGFQSNKAFLVSPLEHGVFLI
jgi:hypothetical protein